MEDPEYAVAQLAQTTMRSELGMLLSIGVGYGAGKLTLDTVFKERASLNTHIVGVYACYKTS